MISDKPYFGGRPTRPVWQEQDPMVWVNAMESEEEFVELTWEELDEALSMEETSTARFKILPRRTPRGAPSSK